MTKARLSVNWQKEVRNADFKPALKRFRRFLEDNGLRASTIESYVFRVGKYLEFCSTDMPSMDNLARFRDVLREKKLSQSSVNNYLFSIRKYHEMLGQNIDVPFIKPRNTIPYFFDEDDISKIFSVCHNVKHYAMLTTMFHACLRASELCELDDSDLDLKALTLRVRDGKGGKDAICYINSECAQALRYYLTARPGIIIDGRQPLFFTDFGQRWDRRDVWRMFSYYKKLAGIEKHGGPHVFGRHSPASLLIKNGCDIVTVKELMRHSDVHTTMRYLHVSDATKREKYEKYLSI